MNFILKKAVQSQIKFNIKFVYLYFFCRGVELIKELDNGHGGSQENPHPFHNGNVHFKESSTDINFKSNRLQSSNILPSGISTHHDDSLLTKQALGEQIYVLIENQYPNDAEKLTGILLEMDNQTLEPLIKDTNLLEQKVEEILSVLKNGTGQMKNSHSESALKQHQDKTTIGEELYKLVSKFDCDQADKITGMLLEMNVQDLEVILRDQEVLEEKVNQALTALNSPCDNSETLLSVTKQEDKTVYGEQLYYKICEWFPEEADKITGMLLELNITTLKLLLEDSAAMREKATHAASVLSETNTNSEIPHSLGTSSNSVNESGNKNSESEMKHVDVTKEELGEQLYEKIEEAHPEDADKITGMLLEMGMEDIQRLLKNPQELQEKIVLAENVL